MVVAMAGDQKLGSAEVMGGGEFRNLQLGLTESQTVTFMIGSRMAVIEGMGSEVELMSGARQILNLNADLAPEGAEGMRGEMGPAGPRRLSGRPRSRRR